MVEVYAKGVQCGEVFSLQPSSKLLAIATTEDVCPTALGTLCSPRPRGPQWGWEAGLSHHQPPGPSHPLSHLKVQIHFSVAIQRDGGQGMRGGRTQPAPSHATPLRTPGLGDRTADTKNAAPGLVKENGPVGVGQGTAPARWHSAHSWSRGRYPP